MRDEERLSPVPMSPSEQRHQPLARKTVLVTRPEREAASLTEALERLGARVVNLPTIQITPPASWEECDKVLARLSEYDLLVFTSAHAVSFFVERARHVVPQLANRLLNVAAYAVGDHTKRTAELYGLKVQTASGAQDASSLGRAIVGEVDVRGKKILFPKGNLAGDSLPSVLKERGAHVEEVVVYETHSPTDAEAAGIKRMFGSNEIHLATFFSPSSVENFLRVFPRSLLNGVAIAVIGDTTAEAARRESLDVEIIAERPTTESLVASIERYYA